MAFLGIGPEGVGGAALVVGEEPMQRCQVIVNQGGGKIPRGQGRGGADDFDFKFLHGHRR